MEIAKAKTAINQAIQNGNALYISYRNNQGVTRSRVILPSQWVNDYIFSAFCHATQQELRFNVSNILEFEVFDTLEEALGHQKDHPAYGMSSPDSYAIPSRTLQRQGNSPPPTKPASIFSCVESADEWSRLIQYYAECLTRENRQQYILKSGQLRSVSYTVDETHQFMLGRTKKIIKNGNRLPSNPVFEFIQNKYTEFNAKLCLGYPFLVIEKDKIAPLIYAPLDLYYDNQSSEFRLQSEGYEISYAALKSLKMTDEEIEAFLEECDQVNSEDSQQALYSLEDLIFTKIVEIYKKALPRVKERLVPGTVYMMPAFFWVSSSIATGNLIRELKELSNPSYWNDVPLSLKQLLSVVPEHEYPPLTPEGEDKGIYVTLINHQQLRALQSVRKEPIVVVTGPPGTGKSQLVLNLLAEAFLKGEKVLFASRNNRAVDVVMERLQNEIGFIGAVRTGNQIHRKNAAAQMKTALNKATLKTNEPDQNSEELVRSYFSVRNQASDIQNKLKQIRKLKGLRASYEQEREQYLKFLPEEQRVIKYFIPNFRSEEAENLLLALSDYLEQILKLKEQKSHLEAKLSEIKKFNQDGYPLVNEFHRIDDQYGDFGDGFLRSVNFATVDDLVNYLRHWLSTIELIENEALASSFHAELKHLDKLLSERLSSLPPEWLIHEKSLVHHYSRNQLESFLGEMRTLEEWFRQLSSKALPLSERLINFFTFGLIFRKKAKQVFLIYEQFHLPIQIHHKPNAATLIQCSQNLINLLVAAMLYEQQLNLKTQGEALLQRVRTLRSQIPEAIQRDIVKLPSLNFDNTELKIALEMLLKEADNLKIEINQLVQGINHKIEHNQDCLNMLKEFKEEFHDRFQELLHLDTPSAPDSIIEYLTKWHNIVCFWKADYGYQQVSQSLAKLPSEEEASLKFKELQEKMFVLGGEIMKLQWMERARELDNEVYQKVVDYITAVEKTADHQDLDEYKSYKDKQKENFTAALQMFPIWATTNLTARTNFPLRKELFDLVIIDEASQCDFASALPLLFRGRKFVIIGDPNQLRHVATLSKDSDRELAGKFGVGFDAFSYNHCSLFDIALRSCGSQPGVLLLNEHYRSDARIISFSNQEFYDNKLIIHTDLTKRNIRRTFLNQFGGMFWLNTNGKVIYPPNGSCYNQTEIDYILLFLPKLIEALEQHEMSHASLGIVTPFREQEERIMKAIQRQIGITDRISVGTAHKFQGDEKDFMIFSTVLGEGIEERTLFWLERTRNLLNVAVTRARVSLMIVGNIDFCLALKDGHCFRRLAEYVSREPGRVVRDLQSFFLIGRQPVEVVGYITDPHNPEHNRTTLRRFIASCSEFVWWVDPYFNDHLFDLWWDVFQDESVTIQEVRLLTARELTQSADYQRPHSLSMERYRLIRSELAKRNINFEVRLLPRRELPHDRLLYTPGRAINMPPFAGAYGDHRHVSEYTHSNTDQKLFIELWEKADQRVA